jgi:hypothetical protein
MNTENSGWAKARLERAHREIPELLRLPNEVTPNFDNWCANIKRALEGAFGHLWE